VLATLARLARFIRANGVAMAVAAVLLALVSLAVRWIATNRAAPPPRKVMQFTVVSTQPPPPPPKAPPPPPQPQQPQKVEEERQEPAANRVELKPLEAPPPDAPPPTPGGGRLALAAEGEGPGDAFNLAGSPGGRGLLSGGGLGDGTGVGVGDGDAASRYAWYYAQIQPDIEAVLRRSKRLGSSSLVAELRLWWDPGGRITRVEPVGASADPSLADEFRALVGLQLRRAPPADVPVPVILRIKAHRPR
jgi:outer membrane biosynthesis protein TonB